jgi:hypothetical protein
LQNLKNSGQITDPSPVEEEVVIAVAAAEIAAAAVIITGINLILL